MVFPQDVSDVPLDKSVISPPPRPYIPTFLEWVSDNNFEIRTFNGTKSASALIYKVPENKSFFITSVNLDIACTGAGPSSRQAGIIIGTECLMRVGIYAQGSNQSSSNSFSMPYKVEENRNINLTCFGGSNRLATYCIIGFLVDRKIVSI